MKGNRTNFIEFSRQLKPQPPKDARPSWYLVDMLGFYKDGKKVWEQKIPEATTFFNKGFYNWLDIPRIYLYGCRVEYDDNWGWILHFRLSHEEAAKIWGFLFQHHPEFKSNYDNEKGQYFTKFVSPKVVKEKTT